MFLDYNPRFLVFRAHSRCQCLAEEQQEMEVGAGRITPTSTTIRALRLRSREVIQCLAYQPVIYLSITITSCRALPQTYIPWYITAAVAALTITVRIEGFITVIYYLYIVTQSAMAFPVLRLISD